MAGRPRLKDGAYDQREDPRFPPSQAPWLPLRSRADVVVFQTEPLTADMTVIGPITVTLFASVTTVDADFTAKLVDVYPSSTDWPGGFDLNLTDAIVRGRYRATRDHAVMLQPGRVYEFTIDPFPTANVFKKGHRIRVDISSSNFPRFDVNPNTGNHWERIAAWSRPTSRFSTVRPIRRTSYCRSRPRVRNAAMLLTLLAYGMVLVFMTLIMTRSSPAHGADSRAGGLWHRGWVRPAARGDDGRRHHQAGPHRRDADVRHFVFRDHA